MKTITYFWPYLPQFFLEREIFQTKAAGRNKTHILLYFSENRADYEIMWKNIVASGRPQMIIWRMSIACWIPKATKALSEYVHKYYFSSATMVTEDAPQCYVIRKLRVLLNLQVFNFLIKPSRFKYLIRALDYGRRRSSAQFYRTLKLSTFKIARYHSLCCNTTKNIRGCVSLVF